MIECVEMEGDFAFGLEFRLSPYMMSCRFALCRVMEWLTAPEAESGKLARGELPPLLALP